MERGRGAIAIKPRRTICGILDLKKPWLFYLSIGPEESVVLDAFLPKVLALVPLLKVELHYVLVVALRRCVSYVLDQMGERENGKKDSDKILYNTQ